MFAAVLFVWHHWQQEVHPRLLRECERRHYEIYVRGGTGVAPPPVYFVVAACRDNRSMNDWKGSNFGGSDVEQRRESPALTSGRRDPVTGK